ncbi:MAG: hypothetical protein II359_03035 [Clostridia bacterium]|nr:hypothetical protein [Clostridia bacterium]
MIYPKDIYIDQFKNTVNNGKKVLLFRFHARRLIKVRNMGAIYSIPYILSVADFIGHVTAATDFHHCRGKRAGLFDEGADEKANSALM